MATSQSKTSKQNTRAIFRKRLTRFLNSNRPAKAAVKRVLDHLTNHLPDSVIFGGMLRDLALTGSIGFSSDIDIVTTAPEHVLESAIADFLPKKNRFGGYRFVVQGCSYDIWRLENTWAAKQGFAKVECFKDLLDTTFFNLDAIAYHLYDNKILTNDDYFLSLQNGDLDINLEANPNPSGMASRALRIVQFKDIALSPRLSEYVIKHAKQGSLGRANNLVLEALKEFHLRNPNARFSLSAIAQMGWKQEN